MIGGQQNDTGAHHRADLMNDLKLSIYTIPYLYTFVQITRRALQMTKHSGLKPHWFHVLLSITDTELHGTAIMEDVMARTEGQLRLWPGKLYGTLREMAGAGLIREVDPPVEAPTEGGKRRFYAITRRGRLTLHEEVERMATLVRVARARHVGRDLGNA
jgi:DNA-binding PadR family transcriptional regulator